MFFGHGQILLRRHSRCRKITTLSRPAPPLLFHRRLLLLLGRVAYG
jgi:hypothetical protein